MDDEQEILSGDQTNDAAPAEAPPTKNTWVHRRDGRIRRTRPGTPADDRYAKFDVWEKW